jgi:hypothetical protein
MNPVHTYPSYFFKNHFNSIAPSTPSGFLLSDFLPKLCMHFSPIRASCLVHLILLDLIITIIFIEVCKLLSSSLRNCLQPPVTSSLLGPNILLPSKATTVYIGMKSVYSTNKDTSYYVQLIVFGLVM